MLGLIKQGIFGTIEENNLNKSLIDPVFELYFGRTAFVTDITLSGYRQA